MTTTTAKVTIVNPDPGCYVEGWWGQYAPVHAIEQAGSFGYVIDPELQAALDCYGGPYPQESIPCEGSGPDDDCYCMDIVEEASDDATEWLNEHTMGPRWYTWHWADGELLYGIDTESDLEEIADQINEQMAQAAQDITIARLLRQHFADDLHEAGLNAQEIGTLLGITRQRVEQIIDK